MKSGSPMPNRELDYKISVLDLRDSLENFTNTALKNESSPLGGGRNYWFSSLKNYLIERKHSAKSNKPRVPQRNDLRVIENRV